MPRSENFGLCMPKFRPLCLRMQLGTKEMFKNPERWNGNFRKSKKIEWKITKIQNHRMDRMDGMDAHYAPG